MKKIGSWLRRDWYLLLMLLAGLVLGCVFYPHLPARVPIHWDAAGHVNGYGTRLMGAFLTPAIAVGIYLLLLVTPSVDPHARNYEKFRGSYQLIKTLIVLLLLVVQGCTLLFAVGVPVSINLVVGIGVAVLFILLGNVMGRFRHNYFVGIRTPWTLASEEVWRRTHRLAGPIWVVGGLAMLVLVLLRGRVEAAGLVGIVVVLAAVPSVYSYILFRRLGGGKK